MSSGMICHLSMYVYCGGQMRGGDVLLWSLRSFGGGGRHHVAREARGDGAGYLGGSLAYLLPVVRFVDPSQLGPDRR